MKTYEEYYKQDGNVYGDVEVSVSYTHHRNKKLKFIASRYKDSYTLTIQDIDISVNKDQLEDLKKMMEAIK